MGVAAGNVVVHEARPRPNSSRRGPLRDYLVMGFTIVMIAILLLLTFPAPSATTTDGWELLWINTVILTIVGYLAVWKVALARTWYVSLAEIPLYYGLFVLGPWEHFTAILAGYLLVLAVHRRLPAIAQRDRLGAILTLAIAWALKLTVLDGVGIPEVAAVILAGLIGGSMGDALTLVWITWDEKDWHYLLSPANHGMAMLAHVPQLLLVLPLVWLTDQFHVAAFGCVAAATLLLAFRKSERGLGRQIAATDAFDAATESPDISSEEILRVFVAQLASLTLADVASAVVTANTDADPNPPAEMDDMWHIRELRVPAGADHTLVVHIARYRGTHGLFSHSVMTLARQLSVRAGTRWQSGNLVADATWQAEHDSDTGLPLGMRLVRDLSQNENPPVIVALLRAISGRETHVATRQHQEQVCILQRTAGYLNQVADRLPQARVYRVGDVTFAMVFHGDDCDELMKQLAKLRSLDCDEPELPTFAVGYAQRVTEEGSQRVHDVLATSSSMEQLRRAHTAVIAAEVLRTQRAVPYSTDLDDENSSRTVMRTELERALERDELELFFQPQVDSSTGQVFGLEALARWNHHRLGVVTPDIFVPLAEESMLMPLMTEAVLRKGARACKAWQNFAPGVRLSVNISVSSVLRDAFLTDLLHIVHQEDIDPELITLELTESVLMEDTGHGERLLSEIRSHGFEVSLDDFGTGYSSLAALHDLPVDEVKIDRSFVVEAEKSERGMTVLRHIVSLMRRLQVRMVAEGVEDLSMVAILQDMGCKIIQGYCYGRPMPFTDLTMWFEEFADSDRAVVSSRRQRLPVVPPG